MRSSLKHDTTYIVTIACKILIRLRTNTGHPKPCPHERVSYRNNINNDNIKPQWKLRCVVFTLRCPHSSLLIDNSLLRECSLFAYRIYVRAHYLRLDKIKCGVILNVVKVTLSVFIQNTLFCTKTSYFSKLQTPLSRCIISYDQPHLRSSKMETGGNCGCIQSAIVSKIGVWQIPLWCRMWIESRTI